MLDFPEPTEKQIKECIGQFKRQSQRELYCIKYYIEQSGLNGFKAVIPVYPEHESPVRQKESIDKYLSEEQISLVKKWVLENIDKKMEEIKKLGVFGEYKCAE